MLGFAGVPCDPGRMPHSTVRGICWWVGWWDSPSAGQGSITLSQRTALHLAPVRETVPGQRLNLESRGLGRPGQNRTVPAFPACAR